MPSWLLIVSYIGAAVAANLLVWQFGQGILPFTAVALIPMDFLARDALHSRWEGSNLIWRMGALVVLGSLATLFLNPAAKDIAIASAAAFLISATIDGMVFHLLRGRGLAERMLVSNTVGAVVDSVAFPLLAFGALNVYLSLGQAWAKIVGSVLIILLIGAFGYDGKSNRD